MIYTQAAKLRMGGVVILPCRKRIKICRFILKRGCGLTF